MADGGEQLVTVSASSLKKPGYVMLKGFPCKIQELNQKPKATANGNDRLHIVGTHVWNGKKYEDTLNLTAGFASQVQVPVSSKEEYSVLDADRSSGMVSVLLASGEVKEDLDLPLREGGAPSELDEVAETLLRKVESGDEVRIAVLSIMGAEKIVEVL